MNVLAIVSAKGGVGKTTLTANLAAALTNEGRVVCVDLDPQNALRLHLGVQMDEMDGLARCTLEGRTWNTSLFQSPGSPEVLPYGTINETDRDTLEVFMAENPNWLTGGLATLGAGKKDFVLIDTPPGPSLYLQQALRIANFVLVVVHADAASYATVPAMEGLIKSYCRERTEFLGSAYIINCVSSDKVLSRDVVEVLRSRLGDRVVPFVIHQDEAVREALASDQLLANYDPHCEATYDLASCAQWVSDHMLRSTPLKA